MMALSVQVSGGWRDVISSPFSTSMQGALAAPALMGGSLSSFSANHEVNSYQDSSRSD